MLLNPRFYKGMTLLEVTLTLSLISVVCLSSVAIIEARIKQDRIHRLALNVQNFIHFGKNHALKTRRDVWGQLIVGTGVELAIQSWRLCLGYQQEECDSSLPSLDSQNYVGVYLHATQTAKQIKFTALRGKVTNGHFIISSDADGKQGLKIIFFYGSSRIRICALNQFIPGFASC